MVSEDEYIFDTTVPFFKQLTYREWHGLVNGFYVGLTSYADKDHEYTREKHYWRSGFMSGWAVKIALILALGPKILTI